MSGEPGGRRGAGRWAGDRIEPAVLADRYRHRSQAAEPVRRGQSSRRLALAHAPCLVRRRRPPGCAEA